MDGRRIISIKRHSRDRSIMTEWRQIAEFPMYLVSSDGQVRSIGSRARILCQASLRGYQRVMLSNQNGKRCAKSVHRLVLSAFAPQPSLLHECNHKNGLRHDNRLENLEWVTRSENSIHRCRVLKSGIIKGEQSPNAKLTEDAVKEIRRIFSCGNIRKSCLAKRFGVSHYTIRSILNRTAWKHI